MRDRETVFFVERRDEEVNREILLPKEKKTELTFFSLLSNLFPQ